MREEKGLWRKGLKRGLGQLYNVHGKSDHCGPFSPAGKAKPAWRTGMTLGGNGEVKVVWFDLCRQSVFAELCVLA